MKYLLVFAVLLVAFWFWRNGRREDARPPRAAPPARPPTVAGPEAMTRCAVCALHLPQSDALHGRDGWYCSPEHLARAER